MIQCSRIPRNATVGLFSPSEPITEERIDRFLKGKETLEEKGFRVKVADNALARHYYMAGTIQQRLEDIEALLSDTAVDILLSSWGGKSCNQLLPELPYSAFEKQRKPFLGFSDVCVLLNAVTAKTGLVTFYGPNVSGKLHETEHSDMRILRDDFYAEQTNLLGRTENVDIRIIRDGRATGKLVGGNLSTFTLGVLGTGYCPSLDGAILFWEAASLTPQFIDQYMWYFRNHGVFERIAGMIIGDFTADDSQAYKQRDAYETVNELLKGFSFPVMICPTFGHRVLENPILPIGATAELDTASGTLVLQEAVIEQVKDNE
jgi:muramoyltetrapeptide carboxypeptidase